MKIIDAINTIMVYHLLIRSIAQKIWKIYKNFRRKLLQFLPKYAILDAPGDTGLLKYMEERENDF